MRKRESYGSLAAGMALGGLLIGSAEGLYREVGLFYSALLYGALWSVAGVGLAAVLSVLYSRKSESPLVGWGMIIALGSSSAVLVRYIVIRDVFAEQPGASWKASLAGLLAGLLLSGIVYIIGRMAGRIFYYDGVPRFVAWSVPALCVAVFAVLTRAGDDAMPRDFPPPSPLKGRGVVLLVIDTLRADALGSYGARDSKGVSPTPHLDAFAQRGMVFEDVSAQASWTRPAMASMMTSRHPSGHNTMQKTSVLPDALPTLAEVMKEGGHKTAGVVTNFNLEAGYGFAQGFDHYRYLAPARYLGAPKRANRLAAYNVFRVIREKLVTAGREPRFFYRSGETVNALGLRDLDEIGDEPFFLYLHYMEPHDPYFGPDGSFARVANAHPPAEQRDAMRAAYQHEVSRFDAQFGRLMAALDARGLRDRVDVLVTADHGEEFQEHGGWWHGETLYQEQIHIPLLAAGPSFASGVTSALARQIDIAPTIAALVGLEAPSSWEGRSLLDPTATVDDALAEENHNGNDLASLRTGTKKIIIANPDNPRGLPERVVFDLASDPGEQNPLEGDDQTLQDELVAARRKAAEDGANAENRDVTAEQEAELRALGYVQ